MTQNLRKILLFSPFAAPYMDVDRQILARFSDVQSITTRGIPGAIRLAWSTLFVDAVFSWFASTYSALLVFLSRILGKKSVIVVGGADVVVQDKLGYGLLTARWKRWLVRYALRHATAVLPVSEYLESKARETGAYDGHNLHLMHPGLDDQFWRPESSKEPIVITVAYCPTPERVKIKGIDVLIQAARLIPSIAVQIVGVDETVLTSMNISVPSNVTLHPWIPETQLLNLYRRSRVCCQPSRIESFSFALAQGMLCECIPVASRVGGVPEVMGRVGYLVSPVKPENFAESLALAVEADDGLGKAARERIQKHFPMQARSERLKKLLEE